MISYYCWREFWEKEGTCTHMHSLQYTVLFRVIWGVRDFKFPWCGGLLHVSRRLFWRYWPSITSNFDTVIKRNCLIHFLQNLMALDGSLNVIQNGQTKFCCLVHGKYTPLIENSYLVISGLLLFYKFNFSAFGLQVSRRSCR